MYYALADRSFEDTLLGYAFLSTPFLNFQSRNFAHVDAMEFLLAGLALLCVSLPSYVIALHKGWSFTGPLTGLNPIVIAALLIIPFAVLVPLYRRIAHQRRRAACEFLTSLPTSLCTSKKSLILRSPGDEASNGLALIYILTLLQIQAQGRAEAYFERLHAKRARVSSGSLRNLLNLLAVSVVFNTTALWSAFSSLLCSIAFRIGFGADIARYSLFLQVTTEVTPAGTWTVTQLNPCAARISSDLTQAPLAHSSYAHPDTPKLIGEWISARIASQTLSSLAD